MKDRIAFATGDVLAEEVPAEPPRIAASVLDEITGNMCYGTDAVECATVGGGAALLEVSGAVGTVLDREVFTGSLFTYVTAPHCVRMSARSASGQLSAPRQLCGAALPTRAVRNELDGHHECRAGEFRLRAGERSDTSTAERARPMARRRTKPPSPGRPATPRNRPPTWRPTRVTSTTKQPAAAPPQPATAPHAHQQSPCWPS